MDEWLSEYFRLELSMDAASSTLLIGEYGSALHDQSVAHIMTNGAKEATCTLLTDSQQEIGVTYSDLSPYPQVGT